MSLATASGAALTSVFRTGRLLPGFCHQHMLHWNSRPFHKTMKMVHAFCLHVEYLCMPKCSMSEFNSGNRGYQHQAATSRHASMRCLLPPASCTDISAIMHKLLLLCSGIKAKQAGANFLHGGRRCCDHVGAHCSSCSSLCVCSYVACSFATQVQNAYHTVVSASNATYTLCGVYTALCSASSS